MNAYAAKQIPERYAMAMDDAARKQYLDLCGDLVTCIMDFMKNGEDIAEFGRKRQVIIEQMAEYEKGIVGELPDDLETANEPEAEKQEPPTFASYEEEAEWYRERAEQGDPDAQHHLGDMYSEGSGVPRDIEQAAEWYRKAAEQGKVNSQYRLGDLYDFRGKLSPRCCYLRCPDKEEALKQAEDWYRKAAEQGHADAQFELGTMLCYRSVEETEQSAEWFRKAAEQGHPEAQERLGFMYFGGRGVPTNKKLAEEWISKAADGYRALIEQRKGGWKVAYRRLRELANLNWANAQYNLAVLYEAGHVCLPQHQHYFWNWYWHAAERGHEKAKEALERLRSQKKP